MMMNTRLVSDDLWEKGAHFTAKEPFQDYSFRTNHQDLILRTGINAFKRRSKGPAKKKKLISIQFKIWVEDVFMPPFSHW